MRGNWRTLGWLSAGLLLVAGCKTPAPNLKPPPRPEELVAPPPDDGRYSKPPQYPEETLNQFPNKAKKNSNDPNAPPQAGFGSGMGGPGGMAGMGGGGP